MLYRKQVDNADLPLLFGHHFQQHDEKTLNETIKINMRRTSG